MLDLEYGLPVQVRDKLSGVEIEDVPHSEVNKEYMLELHKSTGELGQQYKQMPQNETLMKLKRDTPNYKRNLSPVCTFFIRGECNRGKECPFRHELPTESDLTEQNIKDRYYGIHDPVAEKMMERVDQLPKMAPPEDPSITTLFIGGVSNDVTEEDIRDQFYAFGEIESIKVVPEKTCGFVTYVCRSDAERAIDTLANRLILKGSKCHLTWGRPRAPQKPTETAPSIDPIENTPYPSMDPSAMGSCFIPKRTAEGNASQPSKKQKVVKKALPVPKPPPGPPPKT